MEGEEKLGKVVHCVSEACKYDNQIFLVRAVRPFHFVAKN